MDSLRSMVDLPTIFLWIKKRNCLNQTTGHIERLIIHENILGFRSIYQLICYMHFDQATVEILNFERHTGSGLKAWLFEALFLLASIWRELIQGTGCNHCGVTVSHNVFKVILYSAKRKCACASSCLEFCLAGV